MAYILEETISNIRHGGVVSILSVIIITLTTVIVTALTLLHNTIRRDVDAIKSSTAIIVFLSDTISPSEQERLIENISGLRSVKKVVYISKIQALERSNQIFGDFSNIIHGLEAVNPLPASIEIQVQEQYLRLEDLEITAKQIRQMSKQIEEVSYETLTSSFVNQAEVGILGLGIIMSFASIVIIAFSIVLTVYFRREEIEILRLVGASSWYIGIPLVIQGGFLGGFGSLMGVCLSFLIFQSFNYQLEILSFISMRQIFLIVFSGIFFGLLSSILPTLKYANV